MTETVMLPRHAWRALLRAESFDSSDNTIEVVWSTGATVMRYDWDGPYTETLEMSAKAIRLGRLNGGASFLDTHESSSLASVLGRTVPGSVKVSGKEGSCRVKLSEDPDKAGRIGDIRSGVIADISVGYIVHAMERTEAKDGKSASCLVTDWEPIEISAVPIPADPSAKVRSSEDGAKTYPCAVTRQMPEGDQGSTPGHSAGGADPVLAFREAEKARVQALRATATKLGTPDNVLAQHLDDGTSADEFRTLAIDLLAARTAPTPNATPAGDPAQNGEAAVAVSDTVSGAAAGATETRTIAAPPAPVVDVQAVRAQERARATDIRAIGRKLNLPAEFVDGHVDVGTEIDAFRGLAIDEAAKRQAPANFSANPGASDHAHRSYAAPKREKQKGEDCTRILIALAATRGSRRDAADFASHAWGPEGEMIARALGTGVGSGGGFLVPVEMSAEVIELLRPASTVMALDPTIIPMPAGNIAVPRLTGGAIASYTGENQPAQASQQQFGMVQLSAKKLIALVPISNDMLKFPSVSVDGIVRDDMVLSIAQRADLAFLRGNGSQFSPRGLRSFAAETSLGGANVIAANYTVNLQNITSDLGKLELALENANVRMRKPGWVMSPRTKTFLMNLRDGLGNLVYSAEMSRGLLRGKPFKITTQIPNNLVGVAADGTTATTDASEIYFADFAEVLIGEAYGLEIEVFSGGTYVDASGTLQSGISNDQTVMRAIVQHDMGMRQEAAAAVLTGVRWF